MKKIERRALVCCILAMLLAAGLCVFLSKYLLNGGSWVSSAFNRHLYNSSGVLACGTVLDRDGDVLSTVENGERTYYDNADVRRATLHAVGDLQGNIGTGALNAFADKLTYSLTISDGFKRARPDSGFVCDRSCPRTPRGEVHKIRSFSGRCAGKAGPR